MVAPETARLFPVDDTVARLGNDYLLVALLGIVGVATTVTVLTQQSLRGVEQATPPDPEKPPTGERPGTKFDATVDAWRGVALWLRPGRQRRIRERLYEAAVEALTRTKGCSRKEARQMVERGTWTDDRDAAAFLANDGGIDPLVTVGGVLRGEAPIRRRVHRTVEAIERLEGGEFE